MSRDEWVFKASSQTGRIEKIFDPILRGNLSASTDHPIYNFIFKYYNLNLKKLCKFSPGCGVVLEDVVSSDFAIRRIFFARQFLLLL
mmetsp:Transcript_11895/g.17747  ORF Transcript_11895/g.17747 Transcript_11895/m.17747 type:complete len:87 (+) Transcript_11895:45-305(+)